MEGRKVRARSESFKDHFSQATMFWNSMTAPEKEHIIEAFSFELGKCQETWIREGAVEMFINVNLEMAQAIAKNIGVKPPANGGSSVTKASPALSLNNTVKSPATRKVGVLIDQGFNEAEVMEILEGLEAKGVQYKVVSEMQGKLKGTSGKEIEVDHTFSTTDPVLYDAIYAVGGPDVSRKFAKEAARYIAEAFDHYKPIGATHDGQQWLEAAGIENQPGVVAANTGSSFTSSFLEAIAAHRHWERQVE